MRSTDECGVDVGSGEISYLHQLHCVFQFDAHFFHVFPRLSSLWLNWPQILLMLKNQVLNVRLQYLHLKPPTSDYGNERDRKTCWRIATGFISFDSLHEFMIKCNVMYLINTVIVIADTIVLIVLPTEKFNPLATAISVTNIGYETGIPGLTYMSISMLSWSYIRCSISHL